MKPFMLNKNAKEVLCIIEEIIKKRLIRAKFEDRKIREKEKEFRFKDITHWKTRPYDETVRRGLRRLINLKLILKIDNNKNNVRYLINPKYSSQVFKISRQNSDITELQSFPFNDIINLTSTNGKTTVYGIPEEVFNKSDFKTRIFDYSQKETLNFKTGIKVTDICGKYLGVPLSVKIKCDSHSNENEIVDMQVKYYLDLMERKAKPEDIIRNIIKVHRNSRVHFNKLGENISSYLIELKRQYRRKLIEKMYKMELKEIKNSRLKSNLSRLKDGFIGILSHTDYDKPFLRRAIFEFYGDGVGGYSCNGNIKLFWSFHKFINSLTVQEKDILFNFLWKIFEKNNNLFPTNIAFICRGHSFDYIPEGM